jgi:UDPglucose 6-dehydrogenase
MTITIIGTGYVGLPSAAVFAKLGHTVWALRRDAEKIERIKRGDMPFYEPGLAELVSEGIRFGRLLPTIEYHDAIPNADLIFICVGTPPLPSGDADLSHVFAAARDVARCLRRYAVIASKSTVPVSTAEKVRAIIASETKVPFDVASCPEFLREGAAVADALAPDRIVIGVDSERARDTLLAAHASLPGERVITDIRTAEMIKYASNAFLATKISFINEMANLCDEVGANIDDVSRGMGLDRRIGQAFLKAGIGYGGSCFPKDTKALHSIAFAHDYDFKLLNAVIDVNQQQRRKFLRKARAALESFEGKRIGVLGLAFKENTDDVRESAAIDIIRWLEGEGAEVVAYDPKAEASARTVLPTLATCPTAVEVARGVDALFLLTEWPEFRDLPWEQMKGTMRQPIVVDGRNLLAPRHMRDLGFTYVSMGRP